MLTPTKFTFSPRQLKRPRLPVTIICAHVPETGPFSRYGLRKLQILKFLLTVLEGTRL